VRYQLTRSVECLFAFFLLAIAVPGAVTGQSTRPREGFLTPSSHVPDKVVRLQGLVPRWATEEADEGPLPTSIQLPHLTVFLSRSAQNELDFQDSLLKQQSRS
jgi:hypothetical protein